MPLNVGVKIEGTAVDGQDFIYGQSIHNFAIDNILMHCVIHLLLVSRSLLPLFDCLIHFDVLFGVDEVLKSLFS